MMIVGYWLTNVIGFVMMHHGLKDLASNKKDKYVRKELVKDILISIVYTGVVVIFFKAGWLKFPLEYFS